MILNCLVLLLLGYILYKMYLGEPLPFINNYESFTQLRGVSAWDGRGTDLKKCLNNIEGVRFFEYPEYANTCNQHDPFNKYL